MSKLILPGDGAEPSPLFPAERVPAPRTGDPAPRAAPSEPAVPLSIVSKSRLLREGLLLLLRPHLGLRLVGSYAGPQAPDAALPNPANHVVLLDGSMGPAAAVAWTQHWRGLTPAAHVLVLELENDVEVILGCIEAGAGGYTLQGATPAEVATAIRQVLRGEAQCSAAVAGQLFARLAGYATAQTPPSSPPVPLTDRELDVLRYIAADYSNQRIAEALVIEVRTVKHHVHNILEKLQLRHREDAARLAQDRGWLPRDP